MSDGNTCKGFFFLVLFLFMDVSGLDIPDLRFMSMLLELSS